MDKVIPGFITQKQMYTASIMWYNSVDINSLCLAENRLNKGETPTVENDQTPYSGK